MISKKLARGALMVFVTMLGMAVAQADMPAFFVNDQPVSESELARIKKSGWISAPDLPSLLRLNAELLAFKKAILVEAARQDSANMLVTSDELEATINNYRKTNNLETDEQFADFIRDLGFTEAEFRNRQERDLKIQKRNDEIIATVTATDAELRLHYDLYSDFYIEMNGSVATFDTLKPEVSKQLRDYANQTKKAGAFEIWSRNLVTEANVTFPEGSKMKIFDPVVASVDGFEIMLSQLLQETESPVYRVAWSYPDVALKELKRIQPGVLEELINRVIGRQYANRSDKAFFGNDEAIRAQVQSDGTRNVQVSETQIKAFYLQNKKDYGLEASVNLTVALFSDRKNADAFRKQIQSAKGKGFAIFAGQNHGTISELGQLTTSKLRLDLQRNLLDAKKLTQVGDQYISSVIAYDGKFEVYSVRNLKPATFKSLDSVRAEVTRLALMEARDKAVIAWWAAERKNHDIVNNLPAVQAELEARAKRMGP
jgi:PPIC-type PPIASE domain